MATIRNRGKGAYWIGIPDRAYKFADTRISRDKNETAYFKTEFYIKQLSKLEIKISANSRYRLWVNGSPVHSGPLKGDRYRHYYDVIDISDYLRVGFNVMAVKVVAFPSYQANTEDNFAPFSIMANGAGPYLVVEGYVRGRNNRVIENVSTGYADWQVSLDKAISWVTYDQAYWVGAMERVDSNYLPHGWTYSKKPDGQWFDIVRLWPFAPSVPDQSYGIISPFPLRERTIPLLYEEKKYFVREMPVTATDRQIITFSSLENGVSVTLAANSKFRIVLDAGELTTAYFQLGLRGGKDSVITIRYAESYVKKEKSNPEKGVRDDHKGFIMGYEDIYISSGRDELYEPFWFRTFRFVQIDIDTGDKSLTIAPPSFLETGYPLEVETYISSSHDWVKGVWDISLRTLKRCMHETYEDCPYYEQLQYLMDTRSQALFTYMTSNDTRLAEKAMMDFHSSLLPNGLLQSRYPSSQPQIIPMFNIYFILMVEDYYWHTGRTDHIKQYRPTIDSILDWFDSKIGPYGLIEDLGYWPFVDWVKGWVRGVPRAAAKGPSTIHNLMYVAGLQAAARLNDLTDRPYMAQEYNERASFVQRHVEEHCWSNRHGLFKEGPNRSEFSQHAQIWAVLTRLAEGKRAKSILKKCFAVDDIYECSYSMRFYLLRALEIAGLYSWSESIWDDWRSMLDLNLTTCPEDSLSSRSDCHGWSALPLFEFTRCILGVRPLLPGWEKIMIKPETLSLADCSGTVITPKGMVKVAWEKKKDGFTIKGSVPEGVPFELHLPDGTTQIYLRGGEFEY